MKAKPYKQNESGGYTPCETTEATHVELHMPGPFSCRMIPVMPWNKTREGTGCWSWNGDTEKPTLKPSILTKGGSPRDNDVYCCHTFVTDGKVQFLPDSTHEFSGQTVDLLEVE
jgi:hypothetical protein